MKVDESLWRGLQERQHPSNSDQMMLHGVAEKRVRESGEEVM